MAYRRRGSFKRRPRKSRKMFRRKTFRRRRPSKLRFKRKFKRAGRKTRELTTLKHKMGIQPNTKTLLEVYNHIPQFTPLSLTLNHSLWDGNPYLNDGLCYRMNSVNDPSFGAGAGVFGGPAAYHRYMTTLYSQYRVLKSWVTVRVYHLYDKLQREYDLTEQLRDYLRATYGTPLACSLLLDEATAVGYPQFFWTNLKTDPAARVALLAPPCWADNPHCITLRHKWKLNRANYGDDDTWAACTANADAAMSKQHALLRIIFQRGDMASLPAEPSNSGPAIFPFRYSVRIVYKVQYRGKLDQTVALGQNDLDEVPDVGVEEGDNFEEENTVEKLMEESLAAEEAKQQ